jgi:penicillin-binding protein 1C
MRSPGSTLKPFVYGLALERGWRPADVLFDVPGRYSTRHGSWAPENYDERFRGPMRLREALACSENVPAVRLLDEIGPATLHSRLLRIGFDLPEPTAHYGLGLGLGDAGATLEQLTTAYAALGRGGTWKPVRTTPAAPRSAGVPVFDAGVSAVLGDILADPVARAPVFGRGTSLERPYWAAVKTGTSTGYRDNWTIGWSGDWAVGVWAGNFDGRMMGDVTGVTGAGPLWAAVMDELTQGNTRAPPDPPGWSRREACALSGLTPGDHCNQRVQDWVRDGDPDREACGWHRDGCAVDWPPDLVSWAHDAGLLRDGAGCSTSSASAIAYPPDGAVLYVDPRYPADHQRIPLRASTGAGVGSVVWSVNGTPIATVGPGEPALWQPGSTGTHRIALAVDGTDVGSVSVEVRGAPRAP